ncbi:hypothetical protein F0562_013186 [Nyssa sinensis]|uniref:WRKY domain-containing protein n=1 Tax=Nyssa sinensis TaxID=561372 RepID=A0A5J4ZUG1_9ASTE|nr:hypothetical protein F0562_013186 [Nyssa sinensis]
MIMSDFADMSDWDLQAVVRGCTINDLYTSTITDDNPSSCFAPLTMQQDGLLFTSTFPDLFENTAVFDELHQLYKPFYPMLNPLSPQDVLTSISGSSREEREPEKFQDKQLLASSSVVATVNPARASKSKRRKNQQRRVLQVTAEGLSSDTWAWRKYGQKPIKGSSYPRSYYRCSSSKGCLARKQVERSHSDPGMFIITYTAEHSHTQPTHRNSLAGTTRHKLSSTVKTPNTGNFDMPTAKDYSYSPISTAAPSPTTPLSATIEGEFIHQAVKKESREEDEQTLEDMILSDDFFAGLDELDGTPMSHLAFDPAFPDHSMGFPC